MKDFLLPIQDKIARTKYLYTLGSGLSAGRLPENGYWFYRYHYTILPVLMILPVFVLLGCGIPTMMYRQASKQSVVERLREAEG